MYSMYASSRRTNLRNGTFHMPDVNRLQTHSKQKFNLTTENPFILSFMIIDIHEIRRVTKREIKKYRKQSLQDTVYRGGVFMTVFTTRGHYKLISLANLFPESVSGDVENRSITAPSHIPYDTLSKQPSCHKISFCRIAF